jgi:formyl-CoA transferase
MVVDVQGVRGTGSPIKLSRTPVSYRRRPPQFSEHTDEVISEIGLDPVDFTDVLPKSN